jgi:hypothetical protein
VLPTSRPPCEHACCGRQRGNPLALVELPTIAGDADGPILPLTARLERAFAARLREMPSGASDLLLTAAADESGALSEILAAAEILGGRPTNAAMLQPALDAGLVTFAGDALRFRHPLVRTAIYQAARFDRR